MAKASEMLSKSAPSAKDLVGDKFPPANTVELRQEYGAADRAAQLNDSSVPPWEEWLKQKGFGLVGGQAVRIK